MSYDNDVTETLRRARQSQINRIAKSFSENPYDKEDKDYIEEAENVDLEKGVYKDNYENRKLGRVGQQFGGKKEEPNKDSKKLGKKYESENDEKSSIYGDNGYMSKDFLNYLTKNKEKIWPGTDFSKFSDVSVHHMGSKDSNYVAITGKNKNGASTLIDDAYITGEGVYGGSHQVKKNLELKKLVENYKNEDSKNKSEESDSSYQKNIDSEANNLYTELSRDLKEGKLTNNNDKPYKSVSSYLKNETDWADDIDQDKFGEDVDWPTVYGDIVKKVKSLENKSNVKKAIDLDKEDGIEKDEKEDIEKSQLFDSISDYNNSIKFEKTGKEVKDQITNIVLPAKLADLKIAEANADTFLEDCGDKPARNVEPYWLEGLDVSVPYFIYDYDELRECPSYNESVSNSIKSSTINYASDSDEVTARRNYNDTVRQICSQIVDIVACNTILKNLKDNAKLSLTPRQMVAFQFDK